MANTSDTGAVNIGELTRAFSAAITAAQPTQPVNYSDYIRRPGKRDPELARPVFQHGQPIQIKGASADTIKHLDEMQPGEYLGGRVTVTLKGQVPNQALHIDYPWETSNERMENAGLFSSFSDLVQKIAKEQAAKG